MIASLRTMVAAAAALAAVAGGAPALAADLNFPALSGRVVDQAAILPATTEAWLTGWLAGLDQEKRIQVVVVTLPTLQGATIEDYGYRLGRAWGIGEAGRNTGALLIVAPTERSVRIEVGYGLEGVLTDALSRSIIETDVLPAFRTGDYEQGIIAGTASILRTLGYVPADAPRAAPRSRPETGGSIGMIFVVLLVVFFLFSRGGRGRRGSALPYLLAGYAAGSLGRGHRGSGGGSGFHGGGGSFGGGGASGRW